VWCEEKKWESGGGGGDKRNSRGQKEAEGEGEERKETRRVTGERKNEIKKHIKV